MPLKSIFSTSSSCLYVHYIANQASVDIFFFRSMLSYNPSIYDGSSQFKPKCSYGTLNVSYRCLILRMLYYIYCKCDHPHSIPLMICQTMPFQSYLTCWFLEKLSGSVRIYKKIIYKTLYIVLS